MHLYLVAVLRRGDALVACGSARRPRRAFSFFTARFLASSVFCLWSLGHLSAQTFPVDPLPGQPKIATVTLGIGKVVSPRRHKVTFEKVGLQPAQAVTVTLQYPLALAGRTVAVEPLDGGRVLTPVQDLAVGLDGAFTFQYQAGTKPGLYQVRIHYETRAIALQFWVFDNAHLENVPPVLTAP